MDFLRRLFGKKAPPPEEPAEAEAPAPEAAVAAEEGAADEAPFDPQSLVETGPLDRDGLAPGQTAPLVGERGAFSATQQLPMTLEVELIRNVTPSFGHSIDVGRVRSNNQDALVACAMVVRDHGDNATNFGLFAVADGMGGHIDGEKASAQVASTIAEQVLSKIYLPLLQQEPGATDWMEEVDDRLPIADVLSDALRSANTTIISKIPNSGTTATLCVLVGNTLHLAHIGDSRAYLISEGGIEQITRDHSLAQRLFEVGQLTREEMGSFPRRNELYKVLGFTEDIEPDVGSRRLTPGTYLLICSDGLWGEVPDPLIEDVVLSAATPQAACDRLVALANERGGHDNISVVIVQMPRVG